MNARHVRNLLSALLISSCAGLAAAADVQVMLSGDQEVPPVATAAKGSGTVTVKDDMSVAGSVTTTGMDGIMAHIHHGAAGKNGPPIVTLSKSGSGNTWMVPEGSRLTGEQYRAFKAGELYVNVHSAMHKGGELRGQLKP